MSAGEWLAGCNISFDRASLIAAGGFSTRLGRIGSGSTLLSNDEMEASERVTAMGKLAIYAPKAVVEHVIPPEQLTQSWFRRRAAWQAVSDLLSEPESAPALAAIALRRLSSRSYGSGPSGSFRSAAALKRDMDLAYSLVTVTLCGGVEPEQSYADAGLARTRVVDKIGQVFRRRRASRSLTVLAGPPFHLPALPSRHVRDPVCRSDTRIVVDGVVDGRNLRTGVGYYIREYNLTHGVAPALAYNVTMYVMAGLLVIGFI